MTAFSQASTEKRTDSVGVVLSSRVAREVVKDLLKGDSLLAELQATQSVNTHLLNNLTVKDSLLNRKDTIISLLKTRDTNSTSIITLQNKQLEAYKKLSTDQQKQIKKHANREVFHSILIPALIFGGIIAALN